MTCAHADNEKTLAAPTVVEIRMAESSGLLTFARDKRGSGGGRVSDGYIRESQ